MTNLVVRDATLADAAVVIEFNRLLARESEHKELDVETLTRGVRRALERPDLCRYFVAEWKEGEGKPVIVGQSMLTYELTDWRDGVLWWFQSVYVVRDYRGRGVFRALFEHIHRLARTTPDVRGLRLYVEQHNTQALATYQRLGMQPSGHLVYEMDWSGERPAGQ